MRIDCVAIAAVVLALAACPSGVRSNSAGPEASCSLLREASAQVEEAEAGVALSLRLSGSEFDVVTLQDYVGHVVGAWNQAEQGVVQRCFPRVGTGGHVETLASTAELTLLLDGVRVVFKPLEPAHLASLREHVRRQQARTLACACERKRSAPTSSRRGAWRRTT